MGIFSPLGSLWLMQGQEISSDFQCFTQSRNFFYIFEKQPHGICLVWIIPKARKNQSKVDSCDDAKGITVQSEPSRPSPLTLSLSEWYRGVDFQQPCPGYTWSCGEGILSRSYCAECPGILLHSIVSRIAGLDSPDSSSTILLQLILAVVHISRWCL
jgi:hypothetical protein